MKDRPIGFIGLAVLSAAILLTGSTAWASGDEDPSGFAITSEPGPCSRSSSVVFVSDAAGSHDLWLLDRDTGRGGQLLNWPDSVERAPDWNSTCDRIVFASTRGATENGWQIWTVSADGKDPRQLTVGAGKNRFPRWSPDGSSILFSSDQDGKQGLWIMAADGSSPRPILQYSRIPIVHGSWSPDGGSVAFIRCDGSCQVYRLVIGETTPEQLTTSGDDKLRTDWGPGGILFTNAVDGRLVVSSIAVGELKPVQVTFPGDGFSDFDPKWDPIRGGVVMVRSDSAEDGVWSRSSSGEETRLTSISAIPILSGDLNYDGCVDRADYDILLASIRSAPPHDLSHDLNGDGLVNLADVRTLVGRYTQPGGVPCVGP